MAKKKPSTTKSSTATKTKKPACKDTCKACDGATSKKTPSKKPPKKSPPKRDHYDEQEEEIELDDTERKAVDLVLESEDLRNSLEEEVNTVVTQAVRKMCKAHGTLLTIDQAQNVAMVLFGD